jgi:signal transduction histidine kinase/ActR/RegA family two-component response regulator
MVVIMLHFSITAGAVLIVIVVVLLFVLFRKNRQQSGALEGLVQERTIEQNKSQVELIEALEAAKKASKSKSTFLANMSHEIRIPMNNIVGFSELALEEELPGKAKDYIGKIKANAEWMLQLINDILDISKIESGKMSLENIPFDLHELFVSCRNIIMPKAVEKGIMLHFYAEPSIGKKPLGDPIRLRQVFVNLLSNAVKFTNSGIVKLYAGIKEQKEKTITMTFEVKDSGVGMTDDQIESILEPFSQEDTSVIRRNSGLGLGLSITKNIIEMMGGELSINSVTGVGTKFSFELTFNTVEVDELYSKDLIHKEIEKPEFEGEILLCEDNEMNQEVICEQLTRVGIKTVVAENGRIGVDLVKSRIQKREKMFNLVFMDMHMPVMDGLDAATEIQKLNLGIPIVAMTANIMPNDMEIYKLSGIIDCVSKPFTSQELWHCLLKYFIPLDNISAQKSQVHNE